MNPDSRELLIERATTAHRDRDASGAFVPSAAWLDLDPAGREALFEHLRFVRRLESAVARDGLDTTCRAVLASAAQLRQIR